MSLRPLILFVVIPLIASAAAITHAAMSNTRSLAVIAAALFALCVLAVARYVNRRVDSLSGMPARVHLFHTSRRNMRLMALVYAWGALTLFCVYTVSALKWQHGFQYATLMTLAAAVLLAIVHRMSDPEHSSPPPLTVGVLHGLAVCAALVFLVWSGKLGTMKDDWPANYVFLFGGLALAAIGLMAGIAQADLERRASNPVS